MWEIHFGNVNSSLNDILALVLSLCLTLYSSELFAVVINYSEFNSYNILVRTSYYLVYLAEFHLNASHVLLALNC